MVTRQLLDIATLGTAKHHTAQEPSDVLINIAETSIQNTAGFVIPHTSFNPSGAPDSTRPMCSENAMYYLRYILRNAYEWASTEWFCTLALAGMRIHDAYLPQIIRMGTHHDNLRPSMMALLDHRAQWLVDRMGGKEDHWVNTVTPIDFAAELEKQREHEKILQESLRHEPLADVVDKLRQHKLVWGEEFASHFLDVLIAEHIDDKLIGVDLYVVLYTAAYHYPISDAERLITASDRIIFEFNERFSQSNELPFTRKKIVGTFKTVKERNKHILAFRRKMVAAIHNGEE